MFTENDRYILEGYSFIDRKTNGCLNFGRKDLARVTLILNNYDFWMKQQDEEIAELKERLTKECRKHQGAMRIAVNQIKELEAENADLSKMVESLKQRLAEKDARIEELEGQFAYECECKGNV